MEFSDCKAEADNYFAVRPVINEATGEYENECTVLKAPNTLPYADAQWWNYDTQCQTAVDDMDNHIGYYDDLAVYIKTSDLHSKRNHCSFSDIDYAPASEGIL